MMRELYPMRLKLPSLLLLILLSGCERAAETSAPLPPADDWSNEDETLFQEAEALKYALQQHQLEQQRLRDAGLPEDPPAPTR